MQTKAERIARLKAELFQMENPRKAGKRGALARSDFSAGVPVLESFITDARAFGTDVPLVVNDVDAVSSYPMLLNDQLGDCTVAGILHACQAVSALSGRNPGGAQFGDDEALTVYEAVSGYVPGNPSTDVGATLASVCNYGIKTGFTDVNGEVHKLAGWAEIGDPTNLTLIKKALYTFGTVYMAFNLPESAEDQFNAEQPFVPVAGSAIAGGHCMVLQFSALFAGDSAAVEAAIAADQQGIDPGPSYGYDVEDLITWGARQRASAGFMSQFTVEACAVVFEDWVEAKSGLSPSGLNLNQLIAASKTYGS
jgi:hypothetical protein